MQGQKRSRRKRTHAEGARVHQGPRAVHARLQGRLSQGSRRHPMMRHAGTARRTARRYWMGCVGLPEPTRGRYSRPRVGARPTTARPAGSRPTAHDPRPAWGGGGGEEEKAHGGGTVSTHPPRTSRTTRIAFTRRGGQRQGPARRLTQRRPSLQTPTAPHRSGQNGARRPPSRITARGSPGEDKRQGAQRQTRPRHAGTNTQPSCNPTGDGDTGAQRQPTYPHA